MTKDPNILGLTLLGVAVGIFSSTLGFGGGAIVVPGLTLFFHYPIKKAIAVSLSVIVLTALMGAVSHYYLAPASIDFTVFGLVFLGSIVGAKVGAMLIKSLRSRTLMILAVIIIAFAGAKLMGVVEIPTSSAILETPWFFLILLGLLAGTVSSLLGIGGGVVLVPCLNLFFGLPIHYAIATSLAIIAPSSLFAAILHHKMHNHGLGLLKLILPGAIFGAIPGALLANALSAEVLETVLGIFVLLTALKMAFTRENEAV